MPGLVPGIHVLLHISKKDVDGRDKPGHDECEVTILQNRRDAGISADFNARTGEICMIIVFSQIAPSRPMRMLDAAWPSEGHCRQVSIGSDAPVLLTPPTT